MSLAEKIRRYTDDPDVLEPVGESDRRWSAKGRAADELGRARDQREQRLRKARQLRERAAADPRPRDEFLPRDEAEGATAAATETKADELEAAADEIEGEVDSLEAARKAHLQAARELAGDGARGFQPYLEDAVGDLGDSVRRLGRALRTGGSRPPVVLFEEVRSKRDRVYGAAGVMRALLSRASAGPLQKRTVQKHTETAIGEIDVDFTLGYVAYRGFIWSARTGSPIQGFWAERGVEVEGRTVVDRPSIKVGTPIVEALRNGRSPFTVDV